MNPHEANFQRWRERLRFVLKSKRGNYSALAKHLQVRKQTVWRWVNNPWARFPGWAAIVCNVWYYRLVTPDLEAFLREQQKLGQLVSPQADKGLIVRRSVDKELEEAA